MTLNRQPRAGAWLVNPRQRAIAISLGVAFLMLVGKWTAYFLTGSSAILSDAAESVVHIFATGLAAFSIWYANQPADQDHPYGHGRIAYFSAGFEGALLVVAACPIAIQAAYSLIEGPQLQRLTEGLWITAGLGVVNLLLGLYLIQQGRVQRSIALTANGHHVLTDMWTSLGVVLAMLLVRWTGALWIDPVIALALCLWILATGVRLLLRSYNGLMDRADFGTSQKIRQQLQSCVEQGLISEFHQLRHRRVEGQVWIDVHLLVPGELRVDDAHQQVTEVENQLQRALPNNQVMVSSHLEPADHSQAHPEGHEAADPLSTHE